MTAVSPANRSTKNRLRTRRFYLRRRLLPEDVFHLIEDRGVTVRGLVVHLHCGAKLLNQFPLVPRKFRWRHHTHVIVQIAFATAARIGQSLAFDAKYGAALGAFGNLQLLFPVQSRHLQFRTESRLCDAQGNRAIQVRAAPFEERMFFDFEHNVQIAPWPAIRPGLAFAGDTQPCPGIHARWNPQLNGLFALEASLTAALHAPLLHNLSRTLARWTRARDGKKSLLIGQLPAAGARLAGLNARTLFRARAVAGLAVFLARQFDLGAHTRGRFFKRERHVVSQIGPALRAAASTPTTASKQILEPEEISENVVEILEDGVVKPLTPGYAGKPCVTVRVVKLPLLGIAQHAVRFGAFAELYLRLRFVFRIAVRMHFQSRFAVRGFNLLDRRRSRHAQHFVVIPLIPLGHGNSQAPLVHCSFRCRIRMYGYTHHCRTQHPSVKHISRLKYMQNGAVFVVRCFSAIDRLMKMGIK